LGDKWVKFKFYLSDHHKALPWWERRIMTYFARGCVPCVQRCDLWAWEERKKGQTFMHQTGHLHPAKISRSVDDFSTVLGVLSDKFISSPGWRAGGARVGVSVGGAFRQRSTYFSRGGMAAGKCLAGDQCSMSRPWHGECRPWGWRPCLPRVLHSLRKPLTGCLHLLHRTRGKVIRGPVRKLPLSWAPPIQVWSFVGPGDLMVWGGGPWADTGS